MALTWASTEATVVGLRAAHVDDRGVVLVVLALALAEGAAGFWAAIRFTKASDDLMSPVELLPADGRSRWAQARSRIGRTVKLTWAIVVGLAAIAGTLIASLR